MIPKLERWKAKLRASLNRNKRRKNPKTIHTQNNLSLSLTDTLLFQITKHDSNIFTSHDRHQIVELYCNMILLLQ